MTTETPAPAGTKGPAVFLDYDQAELDAAYDQAVYAPNRDQVHARNLANSARAVARIGAPERFAYGATPVEYVDVYRTRRVNAPVFVFVHGGAWRYTPTERFGFAAEAFVAAGAHFAAVQFTGVEETGGNLLPLIEQVRSAVVWIYGNASRFGGDPNRIHVGGHSSGAHLAGNVLVTDWSTYGVPADVVKGGTCCSGMYELAPVALSKRSAYVQFDAATVAALSSIRHLARIASPTIVAYGTFETPEFQRQNREFAAALESAGKPVRLLAGEGYNHFEICETLGNPYGLLGAAVLAQMNLTSARTP